MFAIGLHSPLRLGKFIMLSVAAFGLLQLTSCATEPTTGYEHLNGQIEQELAKVGLGSGDTFTVRVYGEDGLSGDYRVEPSGWIHFPLIGRLAVEEKTPGELAEEIQRRLQDGFIRDPFVSVYVKQYNSQKVFVLGEVERPGTFAFQQGMNVVEAITLAGGFKPTANRNYVVVTRQDAGQEKRIPVPVEKISEGLASNLNLRAGDIIFVPDTLL